MKHLKLFFALFAMLALGVGNAWGAEDVIDYSTTKSALNSTATNAWKDLNITGASGAQYVIHSMGTKGTSNALQWNKNGYLYQTKSGGTLKSVTINGTNGKKVNIYASKSAYSGAASGTAIATLNLTGSDATYTFNENSNYTYLAINGSVSSTSIVSITVTYETSSAGGSDPTITADPTTIDFGTVYQGTTVESKTVAVNFENLTGAVTYSGLSTPFTATGTVSVTGDQITIAADASTIGDYSQILTIASAADSKTAEVTVTMNVVEKPAPTGTFTLHTGDLIEGDYVIVSTNSLKAEVNSERLASLPVTISNDEIVDPDATTIWHIAKSGEYWTLYNANKAKYAASTGAKNKAALLDAGTDDKALWSVTGTSKYEFVNKKNTANSVNANLRYNSGNAENSRWACYSTSTGAALSLYRKAGAKYDVTVNSTTNGTVTADPTSAEAGTIITLTVTPAGGYVLDALTVTDASSNPVTVTENKFTMPASDVTVTATFKENEKPAATLTLSKNGDEEPFPGSWKQDDVVTLPTTVDTDCVKKFVGWSADANCATEPEYAPGASYTLESTSQTLYAVYATAQGGGEATAANTLSNNGWANESKHTSLEIDENVKATITGGDNSGKYYNSGTNWRLYQNENATITISTTVGELKSVKFTFTYEKTGTLLYNGTKLTSGTAVEVSGTSATFTIGNSSADVTNGQIRISKIEVVYTGGVSYSNYSTTCAAALEKPTFSVEEGTYTESKSIELNATEGDIYYTLDGTEPTKSSTPYTAAIDLDECGTTTIKAIAISTESQSLVASATYTINLPITNTEATAYTPAEAIAIIDGECDKTEEVFVKGVVVSTSAFSAEYGNYDVIVKAVDDNSATPTTFTFYRMYKAADKTKFTASDEVIGVGDIITAKGVLKKFNSTYELAEGCYMVERVAYTEPKTDISNTLETAYTVDKAFELISDIKSDLDKEVYVKGLVAVASTELYEEKYLTYSISDNGQTTGNVLKVYDGLDINGVAFTSKDDVKVGDYVVVKGKLLNYKGTYEINKDNQLVEHISAATITIADITMEVDETKTIAATIVPAEAKVTYTIKENAANAISLSGNTITALAEGTATITATVEEGATYLGNSVDFTVTVGPKTESDEVVILAEHNGQWYALKAEDLNSDNKVLAALAVTYFNGTLYNVNESDKISITWTRTVVGDQVTFKNGTNYLYVANPSKTELSLNATAFSWTYDAVLDTYTSNNGARTFLYSSEANGFKNFAINNNVGTKNYSGYPVVTAPVYTTGDVTYTRATTAGKFGTICLPFGSTNYTGAEFFEFVGSETGKVYIGSVDELVAGVPYIFLASAAKVVVTSDGTTAATPGDHNGLHGTFTDDTEVAVGNYILKDNALCQAEYICWVNAYRAYIVMSEVPTDPVQQMPGRRYIGMSVQGENEATGFENITAPAGKTVKAIVNGQLIIIRDGEMYNAQGQKL